MIGEQTNSELTGTRRAHARDVLFSELVLDQLRRFSTAASSFHPRPDQFGRLRATHDWWSGRRLTRAPGDGDCEAIEWAHHSRSRGD